MGDLDKKQIERVVKDILGKSDGDVVGIIERACNRGYDERKLKDRLRSYVSDSSKASKLSREVFKAIQSHQSSGRKRTKKFEEYPEDEKQNGHSEKKKAKNENSPAVTPAEPITIPGRPSLVTPTLATPVKPQPAPANPAQDFKVKEVMLEAQRMIEERKKKLHLPASAIETPSAPSTSSKLAPAEAEFFMQQALEKAKRVAELKARISGKLPVLDSKPKSLVLNDEGNTVDPATGQSFSLTNRAAPTLKANQRSSDAPSAASFELTPKAEEPSPVSFQDPRLMQRGAFRPKRQFKFHEKGEFEQLANRQRAKAKLEKLQSEISEASKKTGISSAVKLAMVAPNMTDVAEIEVPDIEWWDSILLPEANDYEEAQVGGDDDIVSSSQAITNLVEHPTQLRPPTEPVAPQYLKVFLTKKERKKLRRQNRKEALREKTEKIRLGLEPPPEPKVKISNLMRVLGNDAIQDPTKMEAHVRDQMQKRLRKHEEANSARKLTPEQKSAKKTKKIVEDVSLGVRVAVYRLTDISNPAHKFKVEVNAKQLHMTGTVVLHKDVNVVVVEGGSKQQKFFKNLMLKRIKWNERTSSAEKKGPSKVEGSCSLVWEGFVKRRNFGEIKFKTCPLEKQAREHFEKYSVPHYWDMAYSGSILAQEIDMIL